MLGRRFAVAVVTIGAALVVAAPASAWWAEPSAYRGYLYGTVQVHALPGERNDMTATGLPGSTGSPTAAGMVLIRDRSAVVTPPPAGTHSGCAKLSRHALLCSRSPDDPYGQENGFVYVEPDLGDGNDRFRIRASSMPLFPFGSTGAGNDTVVLNDLAGASMDLGDGNDRITVRGNQSGTPSGYDTVRGGAGDDVLRLVNGRNDNPTCGDGNDVLYADKGETSADCEVQHQARLP